MWRILKSPSLLLSFNRQFNEVAKLLNSVRSHLELLTNKRDTLLQKISLDKINQDEYRHIYREISELESVVNLYQRLKKKETDMDENKTLLTDPDMKSIAENEIKECQYEIEELQKEILKQLINRDKDDSSNAIIELRAGAGGREASLFTADIYNMYQRFAHFKGWKCEIISIDPSDSGGYKSINVSVNGHEVFGTLKFESGVHRVQRIPVTDTQGRIHTSTMTVAIMSQPSEVDVKLNPNDLKIDTFRSSGAGGQHVNKTESAIRITHIPTGIIAAVQEERSQHKNKAKAMEILKARIYKQIKERAEIERADQRNKQIGTGERHERIRTYNYQQDRVTDHRLGLTVHGVNEFMDGSYMLEDMIDKLKEQSDRNNLLNMIEEWKI